MRLGGIFHAARGAWSIDSTYELAYFSPSYLDNQIEDFANKHNGSVIKIGNIIGSPNVILIKEAKEIGNQGYELILRDAREYSYDLEAFKSNVLKHVYSDILIFSGGYDLKEILNIVDVTTCKVHLDISNDILNFDLLASCKIIFDTIFLSTSSSIFLNTFKGDISLLKSEAMKICKSLIFKENRGGSRCFNFENGEELNIASQTRAIQHSVGVGDNYDLAYIAKLPTNSQENSLIYASWFAMEYAITTFPDNFKDAIHRLNSSTISQLKGLAGVILPWENRPSIDIYIAAPDFDYVNIEKINLLVSVLKYHNFNLRLPVRENGQLSKNSTSFEKKSTCANDINLLLNCKIVIAVILFDDPGTLIEIGYSISSNIPTFVYDPYNKANNCILTELPNLVSSDLDEIISAVFIAASKI